MLVTLILTRSGVIRQAEEQTVKTAQTGRAVLQRRAALGAVCDSCFERGYGHLAFFCSKTPPAACESEIVLPQRRRHDQWCEQLRRAGFAHTGLAAGRDDSVRY